MTCLDVLEHLDHDKELLAEMIRICEEGGHVLVTVPAFNRLWSPHDSVLHHRRRYTRTRLLGRLSGLKGQVLKASYYNFMLSLPILAVRKLRAFFSEKGKGQSDFFIDLPEGLNRSLAALYKLEILGLRILRYPYGVSLLVLRPKALPRTERRMSHWKQTIQEHVPLAFVFLCTLILFGRLPLTQEALYGGDFALYFYPLKEFIREHLIEQGAIPLWNPYQFSGTPLIGNIQASLFYPLGFLFYLMPSEQAYGYTVVMHCLLASVFMYSFMRTASVSRGGSLLSAFVFTFSGFFMGHLYAGHLTFIQNYIWIPLVFRYLLPVCPDRTSALRPRGRTRPGDSDPRRISADCILYDPGRPGVSLFPRNPFS